MATWQGIRGQWASGGAGVLVEGQLRVNARDRSAVTGGGGWAEVGMAMSPQPIDLDPIQRNCIIVIR